MTKIYLSPSSQEKNLGAIPNYVEEVTCNLIADFTQHALERQGGFEIKRNNPGNTYMQHTHESNLWGADLHICIHTNASNGKARGLHAGCLNPKNGALRSTQLTKAIYDVLSPMTPAADKLVAYTFMEVTKTAAPCAYLELSFHDNQDDCAWILANIENIGEAIAHGIVDFLGRPFLQREPVVIPTPIQELRPISELETTYDQVTLANTSADGTGKPVKVYGRALRLIKKASGPYPFGMSYTGGKAVDAWFPEGSFE